MKRLLLNNAAASLWKSPSARLDLSAQKRSTISFGAPKSTRRVSAARLIGASRLQADALRWAASTFDLTEQKRVVPAKQKAKALEAKYQLAIRLAREINNPLAAMTFTLHLLNTHADLPTSAQSP